MLHNKNLQENDKVMQNATEQQSQYEHRQMIKGR